MGEQSNTPVSMLQRPTNDDKDPWQAYWQAQGQSWRTEPEIDIKQQKYLAKQRSNPPDIEQGVYPFKDIKLNRADVEWLLATYGFIDFHGARCSFHRKHNGLNGLDLRGAILCRAHMKGANLTGAYLSGTDLREAELERANLL